LVADAGFAVRYGQRPPFLAVLHGARKAAHLPGEYVDQESFVRAVAIRVPVRHIGTRALSEPIPACLLGTEWLADERVHTLARAVEKR
jgi:hypothetical protein